MNLTKLMEANEIGSLMTDTIDSREENTHQIKTAQDRDRAGITKMLNRRRLGK